MPRLEDTRLLTGAARFIDDLHGDAWHAVFVRSPHAHARILGIDAADAGAAARTVTLDLVNPRLIVCPAEPRGAIAEAPAVRRAAEAGPRKALEVPRRVA